MNKYKILIIFFCALIGGTPILIKSHPFSGLVHLIKKAHKPKQKYQHTKSSNFSRFIEFSSSDFATVDLRMIKGEDKHEIYIDFTKSLNNLEYEEVIFDLLREALQTEPNKIIRGTVYLSSTEDEIISRYRLENEELFNYQNIKIIYRKEKYINPTERYMEYTIENENINFNPETNKKESSKTISYYDFPARTDKNANLDSILKYGTLFNNDA